jgi:hypothetical protein
VCWLAHAEHLLGLITPLRAIAGAHSQRFGMQAWRITVLFLIYKSYQAWFHGKTGLAKNGRTFDRSDQPTGFAFSFAVIHIGLILALLWGGAFVWDVLHR